MGWGLRRPSGLDDRKGGTPVVGELQSVYWDVGELLFPVVVHQFFVFISGIFGVAGPANKENLGSGPFHVKGAVAGQAAVFGFFHGFIFLCLSFWIRIT